jgi:hypothetical protein
MLCSAKPGTRKNPAPSRERGRVHVVAHFTGLPEPLHLAGERKPR